jgi:RNA polymerase sigma-70 factor, ECF subfamily
MEPPMDDLGDTQQFDRAYREHAQAMFVTADRVLRDGAAAEDVVQDVFMHLWRNPAAFDATRGSLGRYLTLMARSRALDRWRTRNARDAAMARSRQEQLTRDATAQDAVEEVIRRDGRRNVLKALGELPGEQRDAVLLAFGKGLTAREIAAAGGVPLGTVKSRLRLGLEKAREELAAAA